jgi:hypothetical protein
MLENLANAQRRMREGHKIKSARIRELIDVRRHPALSVFCPVCFAAEGVRCKGSLDRKIGKMHHERKIKYIRRGLR